MKGYTSIYGKYYAGPFRLKVDKEMKAAIKAGEIPTPEQIGKCKWCGQTEGKLIYHCEDYDNWRDDLIGLCWRCHVM